MPVALLEPLCKQPVTVTDRDELWELRVSEVAVCDEEGFCALTTVTTPNAMAAHVPDQIRLFMIPPCRFAINATALQLSDQRRHERRSFRTREIRDESTGSRNGHVRNRCFRRLSDSFEPASPVLSM